MSGSLSSLPMDIVNKVKQIRLIVSDADGVLTDGSLYMGANEDESFVKFNIIDGMACTIARECNLEIAVISARKSLSTEQRCKKLHIQHVYTGVADKASQLREIAANLQIELAQIAYIGDDLVDLPAMQIVGFSAAPATAVGFVKQHVDYITKASGGNGALRELVELILDAQGVLTNYLQQYLHK